MKVRSESQMNHVSRIWMSKHGATRFEKHTLTQAQRRHMKTNLSPLIAPVLPEDIVRKPHDFKIEFAQGWAITRRDPATVYTQVQTNFAKRLWLYGNETNQKITPEDAVKKVKLFVILD